MQRASQAWKPVPEFENYYEINEVGEIRSLHKKNRYNLLNSRIDKEGYLTVRLYKNGKSHTKFLHRLIAFAFIPKPANKPYINHKDGNKANNSLENLEWVTHQENILHAYSKGLIKIPGKSVIDSCTGKKYSSIKEAARDFQMAYSTCKNYLNGNRRNPTCLRFEN